MDYAVKLSNTPERLVWWVGGSGEMHITGNVGLRVGGGLMRGNRREGRNGNVYRSTSAPLTSTHSSRTSPLGLQSIISYSQLPNWIVIAISTTKPDLRRCDFPVSNDMPFDVYIQQYPQLYVPVEGVYVLVLRQRCNLNELCEKNYVQV